jgi:hypothetical protein
MPAWLADIVAKLAISFLQAYWAREDLKTTVRQEIALAATDLALKAETWKAKAAERGDAGGPVVVGKNGGRIQE